MQRLVRIAVAFVVVVVVSACMGSFVLTRKLYAWNESVTDSKVINNVLFWALNIVPIYSLAVTGDAVILNFIEFWTGTNILADAAVVDDNARVAVVDNGDGTLTVTRGAEVFVLVPRSDDGVDGVDVVVDGRRVGSAQRTGVGGVVLYGAAGDEIGVITPEEADVGASLTAHALATAQR